MLSGVVAVGGIIGLCTASALHRRGVAVTLLDAGPAERTASHVNAGWIMPTLSVVSLIRLPQQPRFPDSQWTRHPTSSNGNCQGRGSKFSPAPPSAQMPA